jgi:hypothetical protein
LRRVHDPGQDIGAAVASAPRVNCRSLLIIAAGDHEREDDDDDPKPIS